MIKILIGMLFPILSTNCNAQMQEHKFVTYQEFESAYRNSYNLEILSNDFNFLYILLLDTCNKQELFKYDSELKELFKEYSYGLNQNKLSVGFVTQILDIKDMFDSDILVNKLFSCISDTLTQQVNKQAINFPIYVKGNTAIIDISTNGASDIFYLKLHNGTLQVNWLGGTME